MSKKINFIGLLTLLVIAIIAIKFSERRLLNVYFECDENLKNLVLNLLGDMSIRYKLLKGPSRVSLTVFDDKILYDGQVFFLDWRENIVSKVVDHISTYFGFNIKEIKTSVTKPFYREIYIDTKEGLFFLKLNPQNFGAVDNHRINVIKIIITDRAKPFENGDLVIPIEAHLFEHSSGKYFRFVFNLLSNELVSELTPGGS